MTAKYCWRGVWIVVLGVALAKPAAARLGAIEGAKGDCGPVADQIAGASAIAIVVSLAVIRELSVVLNLCPLAVPTTMQTGDATTESAVPPRYDITKEVTLSGSVSRVLKTTTSEINMLGGSHIIVATNSGEIDAAMGPFATEGDDAINVTPGQRIQVTGVMKTIRDQQVFVTRLVLANGRVYTIRNEHGFPVTSGPRSGVAKSAAKGGRL
jgi:hypothetical protein